MPSSFFVHIVESGGAQDVAEGRSEGDSLIQILKLAKVDAVYRSVSDRQTFADALEMLDTAILEDTRVIGNPQPVLHLSAHGNSKGFGLTSTEFLGWDELGCWLPPINQSCGGRLLVCMSTCEGFNAWRMAARPGALKPFWGLVGPTASVAWSDAAIGFATFYHLGRKGVCIDDAIAAMRTASGFTGFEFLAGSDAMLRPQP